MTLLYEDASLYEIELGKIIRIPCKFVQGKSNSHPAVIKNLVKQLEKTKQNYLPIIVKLIEEDTYEAVQNIHILEAARLAQLDFVFCVVMDDEMLEQTLMESGEKIYLEIQTASQKEITEVLDYFKTQKSNVSKINSQKAAKAIVEQREKSKINNLNFLAKKGCGIGKATVTKIEDFLLIK